MSQPNPPVRTDSTPYQQAAAAWSQRVAEHQQAATGYLPVVSAPPAALRPTVAQPAPPRRRRRGLLWAGVGVLVAAVAASNLGARSGSGEFGPFIDLNHAYSASEVLPPSIDGRAGDIKLDFSGLALPAGSATEMTIKLGMGNIDLNLPENTDVQVDWTVRVGEADDPSGIEHGGLNQSGTTEVAVTDPNAPSLHLIVDLGVGDLTIAQ